MPSTAAMSVELKDCFRDPWLDVMNFLNEVVLDFPDAISFAPGRPAEELFEVRESLGAIERWVEHAVETGSWPSAEAVYRSFGQYGRTNGIICDLIARQLELDEKIRVPASAVMVTTGCQEAMAVLLAGLFDAREDVLLASDPTYIGITGLAAILGIEVIGVPAGPDGLELAAVEEALVEAERRGKRARALYDVPDFNNPLGTSLPVERRRELLELAREREILIFEDNPYGMFAYDGEPPPTLKSLDEAGVVIYLGSFAKTLFPGLRLGFLVADQRVAGGGALLAEELSKVKSLTTVNTSPLLQAAAGGLLLENGGSLAAIVRPKVDFYRRNRDAMLEALEGEFGDLGGEVRWNRPAGGFFLTVEVPFDFDEACLRTCAGEYGVIVCPMSYFTLGGGRDRQIRLSFSYVTPEEIHEGVAHLARFVRGRMGD